MEPVNDCVYYSQSIRSQYLNTNQEMGLHQTLVGGPEVVIYPCATPYDHRTIGRGVGGRSGGRGGGGGECWCGLRTAATSCLLPAVAHAILFATISPSIYTLKYRHFIPTYMYYVFLLCVNSSVPFVV